MTGHKAVDYIEDTIKELKHDYQSVTFFHGERSMQNVVADEINFPIAFLDHPITSIPRISKFNEFESERYRLSVFFALKSEFDWTMQQHDVVIGKMRLLAREFINKMFGNNLIDVSITGIVDIINELDVICSGVLINFELTFTDTTAIC